MSLKVGFLAELLYKFKQKNTECNNGLNFSNKWDNHVEFIPVHPPPQKNQGLSRFEHRLSPRMNNHAGI